ncbi:MAG: hypothetical protein BWX71_02690 [Deltaproteobacteria bacterium ADurb.Bin072]|nr:MAG: hypothetical protein BWX71_02690 [Deltaproteobacteria bacterium ADurb.Bin072]
MDTCLLDVLHDSAYHALRPVRERIHIDLYGVLEKLVDEDLVVRKELQNLGHEGLQGVGVVDDLHGTPAEHV